MKRALACSLLALLLSPGVAFADPGNGNGNAYGASNGNGATNGNDQANGHGDHGAGSPPGHEDDASGNPDLVLSPAGLATIGSDQNVALGAVKAGLAMPLDDLLAFSSSHWDGRVIDAKLLRSNHGYFYRLTVLSDAGVSRRVFVDARTGQPLAAP
jgi:hypothetical protein